MIEYDDRKFLVDWRVIYQLPQIDENIVIVGTRNSEIIQLRYSNALLLKNSGANRGVSI